MAHYINIALFLCGPAAAQSVTPASVEAELYRVNPIENFDTCSLRFTLPLASGPVPFLVLMTHACHDVIDPTLVITTDRGTVRYVNMKTLEVAGSTHPATPGPDLQGHMQHAFAAHARTPGHSHSTIATLESARAHTVAVNGASEAAIVHPVPAQFVASSPVKDADGKILRHVPGIERAFTTCAEKHQMLHESRLLPWTTPAATKDLRGYHHFAGPRLQP